jgi:DNA-binding SARP family transcriptional activator/ABC-type branched-subunit amino acid transport system substrate-binding protein/outer membrane protein assembly factor BamB
VAVDRDWQFRVLGPLAVRRGDGEIEIGGGRQRALLALLLLDRGEAVSTDRLIDGLWGDSPPAGAAKTLQVYVSRLRSVLGEGVIGRRGPGYALELDGAWLDAQRFEELLDAGRASLARGDPRMALDGFDEALRLWRGRALGDFAYEGWAQAESARLEELRLLAREESFEARLALGESERLVPELEALIAEHPLRERLRVQAMLALYRAGRQAGALELFQESRRQLVQELGVEPGPELRELQRQILEHAPELGAAARPRSPVGPRAARRLIVVGAVLVAGAATAAALELTRSGTTAVAANAIASLEPANGSVRTQVALPSPVTDMTVGGGSVWALSGDTGTITELDARTGRLLATFAAGVRAVDVAYGGGKLWVLANGTAPPSGGPQAQPATVSEVDPQSRAIVDTLPLPLEPRTAPFFYGHLPGAHLLAWAAGSIWANGPGGRVYRIDPARGRIVATVPRLSGQGIATDRNAVWVRLNQAGPTTFEQVDVRTDRAGKPLQTPAIAPNAPASFAVGDGSLWVPDTYAGVLYRATPGTPPVLRAVPVGVGVSSVAVADGSVWAGDEIHDTLTRIDSTAERALRVIPVSAPQSLAATPTGLWVGSGPAPASTLPQSNCGTLIYGASGQPRYLVASDLALQGFASNVNLAMARAVEWTLRRHRFRAGPYTVGYQSCDDSTPQAGTFDFAKCVANAQLFAKTPRVLGVVGTSNTPCTGEELPLLNQAPTGAVPIVSAQNTFQILTRGSPAAPPGVLKHFYPSGVRNFLRVTPIDTHEIAADALLAQQLGLHRVLVVADDSTGGSPIHTPEFLQAAHKLHLQATVLLWHTNEHQPARAIVAAARRDRADGVFISAGGPPQLGQLIRALRTTLGPHFPIIGTDYFESGPGIWQTAGGAVAAGVYVSVVGEPNARLPPAGQRFLHAFGSNTPSFGAAYAAQATEVLLNAIARSDGARASVLHELFKMKIRNGILGPISFNRYGDLVNGPVTILRLRRGPSPDGDPAFANTTIDRVITPPPDIVP